MLILSDSDQLWFHDTDPEYGIHFFQGTGAHWVVEDGLTYSDTVPTDDVFDITLVDFITSTEWAPALVVSASNDYDGSGRSTASRRRAMTRLDHVPGLPRGGRLRAAVDQSAHDLRCRQRAVVGEARHRGRACTISTSWRPRMTEIYGKVIERLGVQISDVLVDESPPVADAGAPQEVVEGQVVQLDGSASYDPDGNGPLAYGWIANGWHPGREPERQQRGVADLFRLQRGRS